MSANDTYLVTAYVPVDVPSEGADGRPDPEVGAGQGWGVVSALARATLRLAREQAARIAVIDRRLSLSTELIAQLEALEQQGGRVVLSDGTVILVEHKSWDALVGPEGWGTGTTAFDVAALYNRTYGAGDVGQYAHTIVDALDAVGV